MEVPLFQVLWAGWVYLYRRSTFMGQYRWNIVPILTMDIDRYFSGRLKNFIHFEDQMLWNPLLLHHSIWYWKENPNLTNIYRLRLHEDFVTIKSSKTDPNLHICRKNLEWKQKQFDHYCYYPVLLNSSSLWFDTSSIYSHLNWK